MRWVGLFVLSLGALLVGPWHGLRNADAAPPPGKFYFECVPLVVSTAGADDVTVRLITDGTITSVVFQLAGGNSVSFVPQSSGVFSILLSHTQAVGGYTPAEANHHFVGFIVANSGATQIGKFNFFVNVDDGGIPRVAPVAVAAGVQATPHLVNLVVPGCDPATLDFQAIGRSFYSHFPDSYDYLAIVSAEGYFNNRFFVSVSNAIKGVGLPPLDQTTFYGSRGRLKGVVSFPLPSLFDLAETGALHELGHSVMAYLHAGALQGIRTHWPLSTLASGIMGINLAGGVGGQFDYRVEAIGGDQYRLTARPPQLDYSDLELYLLGLAPPSEVGPNLIFVDQGQSTCNGCVLRGPVATLTIGDVIATDGPRVPAYPLSQRTFRVASIIVSQAPLSAQEMSFFDFFAARGEAMKPLSFSSGFVIGTTWPFALATHGRGSLQTRVDSFEVSRRSSLGAVAFDGP
jgi:hypothetical protein